MAYDPGNYTMQRTSSALRGAQAGAALGLGAVGPVGGAIGGLAGGAAGFLMGGPSEMQTLRDEQLKKLLDAQKFGTLGLTEEEMNQLRANTIDPVLAQQRQAELLYNAQLGGGGATTGHVQRVGLEREALERAELARGQQQINNINMQAALAQEAELNRMMEQREEEIQASKQAAIRAALELAPVAGDVGAGLATKKLTLKDEEMLLGGLLGKRADQKQRTADITAAQSTAQEYTANRVRKLYGLDGSMTIPEIREMLELRVQLDGDQEAAAALQEFLNIQNSTPSTGPLSGLQYEAYNPFLAPADRPANWATLQALYGLTPVTDMSSAINPTLDPIYK
jgi:hypothetical protein